MVERVDPLPGEVWEETWTINGAIAERYLHLILPDDDPEMVRVLSLEENGQITRLPRRKLIPQESAMYGGWARYL